MREISGTTSRWTVTLMFIDAQCAQMVSLWLFIAGLLHHVKLAVWLNDGQND
jgi:hypothetical protein